MSQVGEELIGHAVDVASERAEDVFITEMEALLIRGASEQGIADWLTGRRPHWADVWRDWLELKHAGQPRLSDPPGTVQA